MGWSAALLSHELLAEPSDPLYRSMAEIMHQSRLNSAKSDVDLAKDADAFYRAIMEAMESEAMKKRALERVKALHPDLKECPITWSIMQTLSPMIIDVFAADAEPKFV